MRKKFQLLIAVALGVGLMIARPAAAFDEDKCTEDVGTVVTAKNGDRFCFSKVPMPNWFTAFSWCKGVGGEMPTLFGACKSLQGCDNLKGRTSRAGLGWLATPRDKSNAYAVRLSDGQITCYSRADKSNPFGTYYALCK